MTSNNLSRLIIAVMGLALLSACGSSDDSDQPDVPAGSYGPYAATVSGSNTVPITLATPGVPGAYVNEPTVSVKVCVPGSTTQCQTINNVLLDTGSFGLRIFQSILTINLTNETTSVPTEVPGPTPSSSPTPDNGSGTVAECAQFGTGMDWGPIAFADVYMGDEPVATISANPGLPVQLINANFGTVPAVCVAPDTDPVSAGYNGILGVGQFGPDCAGSNCSAFLGYEPYYKCDANGCGNIITANSQTAAFTTSMQVTNPATAFSSGSDTNGLAVVLPAIPAGGATAVTGTMVFGIGTESNNTPSGLVTIKADSNGYMLTQFNDQSLDGFIDSGSNGLYFPATSSLPNCSDAPGFFCSNPIQQLSATMTSASGSGAAQVNFEVVNSDGLFNSGFSAFPTLAGGSGQDQFDWGLPFFYGRTVYVGFNGKSSSLGTGPLWAF